MPTQSNLRILLERLTHATQANTITWEETDRKFAFTWANKSSAVLIYTRDNDGAIPIVVQILNSKGEVLEMETSHYEDDRHSELATNKPYAQLLEDLFNAARRQVLGVDKAIEDLLSGLPDPDEPPF